MMKQAQRKLSDCAQATLWRLQGDPDSHYIHATELGDGTLRIAILHSPGHEFGWTVPTPVLRGLEKRGLVSRQRVGGWETDAGHLVIWGEDIQRRDVTFVLSDEGRKVL